MKNVNAKNGFTLIELLVVVGVVSILVVMSAVVTDKYFARRAIDKISYDLTSTLSLAKLQAARHGVEYQTVCDYDATTNIIDVEMQRGNSNVNTDFDPLNEDVTWEAIKNQSLKIEMSDDYIIDPGGDAQMIFHFNPNGTHENPNDLLSDETEIIIAPDSSKITKCGIVTVREFGRISTVIGNWDGTICSSIRDLQQ